MSPDAERELNGTLQSPNFPQHYDNDDECIWVLQPGNGMQLFSGSNLSIYREMSFTGSVHLRKLRFMAILAYFGPILAILGLF